MDTVVAPERKSSLLRWWFENRITGEITVGQFPNWPLFALAVTWVVGRLVEDGTRLADGAAWVAVALWLYWGADELVRGVNPWRRLLGTGVVLWQLAQLLR
jgi:hypothetical protein